MQLPISYYVSLITITTHFFILFFSKRNTFQPWNFTWVTRKKLYELSCDTKISKSWKRSLKIGLGSFKSVAMGFKIEKKKQTNKQTKPQMPRNLVYPYMCRNNVKHFVCHTSEITTFTVNFSQSRPICFIYTCPFSFTKSINSNNWSRLECTNLKEFTKILINFASQNQLSPDVFTWSKEAYKRHRPDCVPKNLQNLEQTGK